MPTNQLCFAVPEHGIKLIQTGFDQFTVVYDKQIERNLDYVMASRRLGCAIMHAAACDGRLDSDDATESQNDEPYFECPVTP